MWSRFEELRRTIIRKRNDIALVALWTLLVSFLVIRIHAVTYAESVRLQYYQIPLADYGAPMAGPLDLVIVAIAGLIVGFFLSDIKEMFYGYLTMGFLSFIIGVVYVTLYIWFTLGWGPFFSYSAFDWEYPLYMAIATVFRIMFPWLLGCCLVGLVIAAFVRTWIFWS